MSGPTYAPTPPFTRSTPPQFTTNATFPSASDLSTSEVIRILLGGQDLVLPQSTAFIFPSNTPANDGIFGFGTRIDPVIIFALAVAGLVFLILLVAVIYCCCRFCAMPVRPEPEPQRDGSIRIKRTSTLRRSFVIDDDDGEPRYLGSSITESPYSIQGPAGSVLGAYSIGRRGGTVSRKIVGSYPRRGRQEVVHTVARKKYLCPADVIGMGNDVTYGTSRPSVITTLGDGYVTGHSLRSVGNRYATRRMLLIDDEPYTSSPQIITLE